MGFVSYERREAFGSLNYVDFPSAMSSYHGLTCASCLERAMLIGIRNFYELGLNTLIHTTSSDMILSIVSSLRMLTSSIVQGSFGFLDRDFTRL